MDALHKEMDTILGQLNDARLSSETASRRASRLEEKLRLEESSWKERHQQDVATIERLTATNRDLVQALANAAKAPGPEKGSQVCVLL